MTEIAVAHTADVGSDVLAAVRDLLEASFHRFMESDWEHTLGGLHALAFHDGALVGHAALVQRRLLHRGRALRTGYIEGVAVRVDRRRTGVAAALMAELERATRAAYEVGALSASSAGVPLYLARGWHLWRGPTSTLSPRGILATPGDDGSVFVLPVTADLDLDEELTCDWRDGEVW